MSVGSVDSMVEVTLTQDEDFLKVKETLTRIGVASRKNRALYQSCHILHKQQKYYIVHFKELFALDGKPTNFSEEDIARRNTIANLLIPGTDGSRKFCSCNTSSKCNYGGVL